MNDELQSKYTVSWFSAGVSSAVATRLAIDEIDEVLYIHIDDQHPDTLRFVRECEEWFGTPITILQSNKRDVRTAIKSAGGSGWINGVGGAACTRLLKRRVRQEWEQAHPKLYPLRYVWGMDTAESHRADRIRETMIEFDHLFPLLERGIGKAEAHEILRASRIKRPAMYELGYHNNNCVGCVKGGMGYWNKIRVDFPEVFAAMARLEREVGASCINGVFLDELDPKRGRRKGPVVDDCGILCEIQALPEAAQAIRDSVEYRWLPNWYATRLHAVLSDGRLVALCGHVFEKLPHSSASRRMVEGLPKCSHCIRKIKKLEQREK